MDLSEQELQLARGYMRALYNARRDRARENPTAHASLFWTRVNKETKSGCWEWTGQTATGSGYGLFRGIRAHRFAWTVERGEIADGLQIDHLCRNRICVNPAHLEPVTPRENILRGNSSAADNARKVLCKRGHLLFGKNMSISKKGWRECVACNKAYDRIAYQKRKRKRLAWRELRRVCHGIFR